MRIPGSTIPLPCNVAIAPAASAAHSRTTSPNELR
jgi:hypothetical protein